MLLRWSAGGASLETFCQSVTFFWPSTHTHTDRECRGKVDIALQYCQDNEEEGHCVNYISNPSQGQWHILTHTHTHTHTHSHTHTHTHTHTQTHTHWHYLTHTQKQYTRWQMCRQFHLKFKNAQFLNGGSIERVLVKFCLSLEQCFIFIFS